MTTTFADLGLIEPLARAVGEEGYTEPTPIQIQAIPHVLAGRDLLGLAQTGTGKTAAFALPILQRLAQSGRRPSGDRPIAVLILTPTRELAAQIGDSFAAYGRHLGFQHTVIFGGVGQNAQERALRQGIDVLVATPGRLLDLCQQRIVHLGRLDVFVLDEADRMLDMGFVHDVRRVIALLPSKRQTLFFSATMPPEAQKLADALLHDPASVAVAPVSSTVDTVEQYVYMVEKNDKRALLVHLLKDPGVTRALVFTRTKHAADRVTQVLHRAGVTADAIHGNKSQNNRERALGRLKSGQSRVLVATDIAARGIDIDEVSHVVNFDLPNVPETYVHRIGRTARAGARGVAFSFCDAEERAYLADIERLIRRTVSVVEDHPHRSQVPANAPPPPVTKARPPRQGHHGGPRHHPGSANPRGSGNPRELSHPARQGGQPRPGKPSGPFSQPSQPGQAEQPGHGRPGRRSRQRWGRPQGRRP
jgi:ATP-dependent RNA helicase RhlE